MCLLDIPSRMHLRGMEFGIHRGAASAFAIVQLHYIGCLHDVVGLPVRTISANLEPLSSDFDVATNTMLRVVSVEEIIRNLS